MEASQNTSEEAFDTITTLNPLSQFGSDAKGITEGEALINAVIIV